MQGFLKTFTAILLTVAVICAAGCKKTDDPNNNGNNNGGNNNGGSNSGGSISGGGNNGGHNGGTAEGMYVGVIGFNEALYTKEISLLNSSTERNFINFIDGLSMRDATALYHADNTALDWLRDATLPNDLINVSLVTFTDGLDNASLMLDDHYSSQAEFLNAVNNRIMNDKVQGKSINAYAIGMKGNDVVDEEGFRQNLRKLSSSESNVFEVEDMDEATERFSEIASQLYNESTTFGVSVKIPGGYDNNTVVRITFDNVSEANSSSRYIQATYSREGGNVKLSNVSYNGLQSLSGTSIIDSRQDGLFYWFTFMELRTLDNEPVTDMTHTKLWRTVGSTAEWQPESEFTPSGYSDVIVERKSAVTVLVLDCTTSLGTQDFRKMKDAAKEFIRVLNDNSGGNGGGNGGGNSSSYTISVSTNPNNGGTVTGGGTYQQGQSCTVSAIAAPGYTFLQWTENGNQISTDTNYTFIVTGNRTLVAQFQTQSYTITASTNPSNGGSVSGGGSYIYGQSCTLTATANTGYSFLCWTENGSQVSTSANYTFTVTSNRALVAKFVCSYNGYAYVDLGLPSGLLWATCNVGADNPEDFGDYFAWGETQPKDTYDWSTYQYCMGSSSTLTKYCNKSSYGYNGFTDNLTTLLPEDDAATANWGTGWRMPTKEEFQELYNNTTVTWTTQDGWNGRLFTAANGNSLFLPAAGFRDDSSLLNAGSSGVYWSSSLYTDYPNGPNRAWGLGFSLFICRMEEGIRNHGFPVRPVCSSRQN